MTMNAAPKSAERGSTRRALGPTTRRTACGTMSPTNPMSPASATEAAVTSAASPSSSIRSRRTSTPRWAAASSPSSSASRARARETMSSVPMMTTGNPTSSCDQDALAKLPRRYETMRRRLSPDRYIAMASPAASTEPTA